MLGFVRVWLLSIALLAGAVPAQAREQAKLTIAAAADLHHALDEVVAAYRQRHPQATVDVVYGSSGKLATQIEQDAPFDLFFSADSDYPKRLAEAGKAGGTPVPYAIGHVVLWSANIDLRGVAVADLAQPRFGRIAIANPRHAPYGKRAEQALRAAGVWEQVQPRLVYGENIAQAAQFARTGNADVGILAESLARDPGMSAGSQVEVPASSYEQLLQSFVVTRHGADNAAAADFAAYVQQAEARAILSRYGFNLPAPQGD